MSDDPRSAPPEAPAGAAESTEDPAAEPTTPSPPASRKVQIKIGSQRDDFRKVKRSSSIQEVWPESESKDEVEPAAPPPAETPPTEEPAAETPADEAPAEPAVPHVADNVAAAAAELADLVAPSEDGLSPELQAEIDAALGDVSLNDDSFERMIAGADTTGVETELEVESRYPAKVVKVDRENIFFSVGARNEAVASMRQFDQPPEVGDEMDVVVARLDPEEGLYEVTVPGASVSVGDWPDLHEGMVVEARITGHNSGGLECQVNAIRGFIPASQIALYHVENLEEFVGQKMPCVVTEADPQRRNLVLSHRAVLEREREEAKQKLWEELEVGQVREGVVRRLHDFGAFVDLGGVDGLIHVSQLSWDRVDHPSEVLQEGQSVKVKIERIDRDTERIGLSYRDLIENPWTGAAEKYPIGSLVTGAVTRLMKFGAFVKLEPGVEGLIHISELAHHRVLRVSNVVKEGQEVEVKVMSVDVAAQRIGLSLKAAMAEPEPAAKDDSADEPEPAEPPKSRVPKRTKPLKGGLELRSDGDQFGLKW